MLNITMLFLSLLLNDEQIRNYKQPDDTCDFTQNCISCVFKMLNLYDDRLANESTKLCKIDKEKAKITDINFHLNQVISELINFYFQKKYFFELQFFKLVNVIDSIEQLLPVNSACIAGIKFENREEGHALILRKNESNQLELIDPQHSISRSKSFYELTEEQQKQIGLEKTENYSRIVGKDKILFALYNNSNLFGNSRTYEEFKHNTYIGLVKFYEMSMQIDGGSGTITETTNVQIINNKFEKDSIFKVVESILDKGKITLTDDKYEKLYNGILSLIGTPDKDDKDGIITHLISTEEGEDEEQNVEENKEYFKDIEPQPEDSENEEQTGGVVGEKRKRTEIEENDVKEDDVKEDEVEKYFFKIKKILKENKVARGKKKNDEGNLIKVPYETTVPALQCVNVLGENYIDKCWLCGGYAPYKEWNNTGKPQICNILSNKTECEHVLPANMMLFMNVLNHEQIQKFISSKSQTLKPLQKMLYENSCHLCNKTKDNGLYIQKIGENFEPNIKSILIDVITFFLAYENTSMKCSIKEKIPTQLEKIGTLVKVKEKLYPNPIRAQLDVNFESPSTEQSQDAIKAEKASTNFTTLMKDIKQEHSKAFNKLLNEPNLDELYEGRNFKDKIEGNKLTEYISNKKTFHKADELVESLKNIAKIKRNTALNWIVRRFCILYDKMEKICDNLNGTGKFAWELCKKNINGEGYIYKMITELSKNIPSSSPKPPSPKRRKIGGQRVIEITI